MKIERYSITKGPWASKSPAIYALNGSAAVPMCYLRKPKHLSEESWKKVLDMITMEIPEGTEI